MTEKNTYVARKQDFRVRKNVNGKWVCDIGSFQTFDEAVNYAKHNLGTPETGAEYLPIQRNIRETTTTFFMPA